MLNYQTYIQNCIKNKYSESTIINQKFYVSFKESRKNILKYCFENLKKIEKNIPPKDDNILKFLKKSFFKKKLTIKEKKKIFNFYVKFNVHLRLLQKNGKETTNLSYLYLGGLLINMKNLNQLQKLNCILKIIDNLSLIKKVLFNIEELGMLISLINFEKKCLEKIISQR